MPEKIFYNIDPRFELLWFIGCCFEDDSTLFSETPTDILLIEQNVEARLRRRCDGNQIIRTEAITQQLLNFGDLRFHKETLTHTFTTSKFRRFIVPKAFPWIYCYISSQDYKPTKQNSLCYFPHSLFSVCATLKCLELLLLVKKSLQV